MKKRFILGILSSLAVVLANAMPVLAVPTSITNFKGEPSNTSIHLLWTKSDAANTRISYLTTGYPANYAAGTSAYTGTGAFTTIPNCQGKHLDYTLNTTFPKPVSC